MAPNLLSSASNSFSKGFPNKQREVITSARPPVDSSYSDGGVSRYFNALSLGDGEDRCFNTTSDATNATFVVQSPVFVDQVRSQNVWDGEKVLKKLFEFATKDKQFYVIPHSAEPDELVNTRLAHIKLSENNPFVRLYDNVSKGKKLDFKQLESIDITRILFVEDLEMSIILGMIYIEQSLPHLKEKVVVINQISSVLEFLDELKKSEDKEDNKHILVILDMDFPD
ncbi:MAG: hypothetical protein CMP21_08945 [Rickettsiales bacterium]|nr:hypothetical protein [Rickettsiales bacterium]